MRSHYLRRYLVLQTDDGHAIGFVIYFKRNYGIHTMNVDEPLYSAATSDFGAPGPVIDFQAPLSHTLIASNSRKKGIFENLFLEGRPPVNVGVSSGGDLYGGSQISFTDVLGEHQFNLYAASISQYRTLAFSYVNQARRFQWATQAFSQTEFFFGLPTFGTIGFLNRNDAIATRTTRGGSVYGIYPINRFSRLEMSAGVAQYNEQFDNPALRDFSNQQQLAQFGTTELFRDGLFVPLSVAFIQETTVFREFGPVAGNTMRLAFDYAPKIGNSLSFKLPNPLMSPNNMAYCLRPAAVTAVVTTGEGPTPATGITVCGRPKLRQTSTLCAVPTGLTVASPSHTATCSIDVSRYRDRSTARPIAIRLQ